MGRKSKKKALNSGDLATESKGPKIVDRTDQFKTNRNQLKQQKSQTNSAKQSSSMPSHKEMQGSKMNCSQTKQVVQEEGSRETNTYSSRVKYSSFSGVFSLIPEENPVLTEYESDTPISTLCRADITYDLQLTWTFNIINDLWQCKIFYNHNCISWSSRPLEELAAEEAAREALIYMRKYCYTMRISEIRHETTVCRADLMGGTSPVHSNYSGLIRKVEGYGGFTEFSYRERIREQTVELMKSSQISSFDRKCWKILNGHFGNTLSDLVFRGFQDEEILLLESYALKLGCSCERYFLDGQHVMIVSHNHGTQGMIDILKRSGGTSGKYTLMEPYIMIH